MATLNTVDKVGKVLDLFTLERPDWGVSEVAAELGIPRSSAHAMLSSLVDIGILQWRQGGRYRIGWRVLELAEVRRRSLDIRGATRPALEGLASTYGETCHVAVRDHDHALYLDKVLGNHNITVQGARLGARLPLYCTGVGKVLLAFEGDAEVDEYLATVELQRFTPSTITDPQAIREELAAIRRNGYGSDLGESVEDVYCFAAPIRSDLGDVVAALSMSAPVSRFDKHRAKYLKAVQEAAADASRALVDSAFAQDESSRDYPAAQFGGPSGDLP